MISSTRLRNLCKCSCGSGTGTGCTTEDCPCYAEIVTSAYQVTAEVEVTTNTCNVADVGTDTEDVVTSAFPGDSTTIQDFLCDSGGDFLYMQTTVDPVIGSRSYHVELYCPCNCDPKVWKYIISEECGQQSGEVTFVDCCDTVEIPWTINCTGEVTCTLSGTLRITVVCPPAAPRLKASVPKKKSLPVRGQCAYLGKRTEYRQGCFSGRMCRHDCNHRLREDHPDAVPGKNCRTCPDWAQLGFGVLEDYFSGE